MVDLVVLKMASVQPTKRRMTLAARDCSAPCSPAERANILYALRPSHPLPIVDLSVSIKSRLLSRSALEKLDAQLQRYNRLIFFTYLVGSLGYPVFLLLNLPSSRWLSVVVTVVSIPATIVALSYLRYNIITLLLASTYEVWFFTGINTITFLVCGVALGDIRCVAQLPPWLGIETNIFVDANVRAVRRLVWSTLLAMSVLLLTIPLVTFGWVHGITNVVLWRYNTHTVTSYAVMLNGIMTLTALLFRNIYRNRARLRRKPVDQKEAAEVSCVSYRCTLRFVQITNRIGDDLQADYIPDIAAITRNDRDREPLASSITGSHLQEMRFVSTLGVINAGNTVAPFPVLLRIDNIIGSKRVVWVLLRISIFLTLAATPMDKYLRGSRTAGEPEVHPWPQFLALTVTSMFFAYSCAHCQRQLLRSIATSFDFLFLEIQSLIIHLAMCDFFEWNQRAVPLVALSWIWIHWVFLADALTPMARHMLGIKIHIFAHVAGFCIGTSVLVLYLMIFSEGSAEIYDRVLFAKKISNFEVELRVSPTFYSCFMTVLGWELNFFWRVCTYGANDLFMVDGAITYTNYLRLGNQRSSVAVSSQQVQADTEILDTTRGKRDIRVSPHD